MNKLFCNNLFINCYNTMHHYYVVMHCIVYTQQNAIFYIILLKLTNTMSECDTLSIYGFKDHICHTIMVQNPSDLLTAMIYTKNAGNMVWFGRVLGSGTGGISGRRLRKQPQNPYCMIGPGLMDLGVRQYIPKDASKE